MGHKFAYKANIRRSLARLVKETDDKYGKKFAAGYPLEKTRWRQWKVKMLKRIVTIKPYPDPLERKLDKGIRDLKAMDAVVKQTDKNLGLIAVRGDIYNAMVRDWLKAPDFRVVGSFPHGEILKKLKKIILDPNSRTSKYQRKIWLEHATKQKEPNPFYVAPKIHKKTLGSRPITAQHSFMLAPVSRYLAKTLQPRVETEKSIGIDSKTTVGRLEKLQLPKDFVFLTYDVEACYPSIDLEDAIDVLWENCLGEEDGLLLSLVMHNNFVTANDKIYHQLVGTATGTQVAPPFANLYLYHKFRTILQDESIIFQERYIDDGLLLVKTKADGERIMEALNQATNLNLTFDISETEAIYLDLNLYKGPRYANEGKVDMRVYFKPTNKMLYLPAISNHPEKMKSGIVTGEAIRTLRNTSEKSEWLKALHKIFKGLLARGYKAEMIKKKWKQVHFKDREFYIITSTTKKMPEGTIIRTSYNPGTLRWWNYLLRIYPVEEVLKQRRMTWNKRQGEILKLWPPAVMWMDFRKIGNKLISAKATWVYVPKRKRDGESDTDRRKRMKLV